MEHINKSITKAKKRPIKVVQFGEGNFLRAFVDYIIDIANEKEIFDGSIAIVKPRIYGSLEKFESQECQYSVLLRGLINNEKITEKRIITSIDSAYDCYTEYEDYLALARLDTLRFMVSNTTEAGIRCEDNDYFNDKPANSFPAKVTQFLYERATTFNYDNSKGLIILPVELIDNNGDELKKCVLTTIEKWGLSQLFKNWVLNNCIFTNTLVDRIVPGYPKSEVEQIWNQYGFKDELLVTAEPFALWVIESEKDISKELPLDRALENKNGMSVIFTKDHKPYKQRKVRILNGAHTSISLASYLAGNNTVLETMNDSVFFGFFQWLVRSEIIPTLDLPKNELLVFYKQVEGRFKNPYIKHDLLSISLNSVSKWKARCYPSLIKYIEIFDEIPKRLCFSLSALICFYQGIRKEDGYLVGLREDEEYKICDDEYILDFFLENKELNTNDLVKAFVDKIEIFEDISEKEECIQLVVKYIDTIKQTNVRHCIERNFLNE